MVEALALSRPDVGFSLRSDGRRTLALPAAADLRERIARVHGLSLARSLIALEAGLERREFVGADRARGGPGRK